jgi:D-alanine-D-alanine ligase-like ATP-grasp enzyme
MGTNFLGLKVLQMPISPGVVVPNKSGSTVGIMPCHQLDHMNAEYQHKVVKISILPVY